MRCTPEMHAHEVHVREMHAYEVHVREMHVCPSASWVLGVVTYGFLCGRIWVSVIVVVS
jgi:hypothetical protein